MQKSFQTPGPVSLYVEVGSGGVTVHTDAVSETVVDVNGRNTDDVIVEQRGDEIVVIARQRGGSFLGRGQELDIHVSAPFDSRLTTKLGSADVRVLGRIGESMLRSGSGDVSIEDASAGVSVETGSGDVRIQTSNGALQVKSGSGDLTVDEAHHDVLLSTASGDLVVGEVHRGQLTAKNVSGDVRVGIPAGIPVWTDVTTMTGSVRSNLDGAGEPSEGQDYIELRAKTVSGDIILEQL